MSDLTRIEASSGASIERFAVVSREVLGRDTAKNEEAKGAENVEQRIAEWRRHQAHEQDPKPTRNAENKSLKEGYKIQAFQCRIVSPYKTAMREARSRVRRARDGGGRGLLGIAGGLGMQDRPRDESAREMRGVEPGKGIGLKRRKVFAVWEHCKKVVRGTRAKCR